MILEVNYKKVAPATIGWVNSRFEIKISVFVLVLVVQIGGRNRGEFIKKKLKAVFFY